MKVLHTIHLIRKYFTKYELLQITTSNYLSILYCNAQIWLLPTVSHNSKHGLLAAQASPLKLCTPSYDYSILYERLHSLNNRATPTKFMQYKIALLLHRTYNKDWNSKEFFDLFFNQNFNAHAEGAKFLTQVNLKSAKT